MEDMNTRADLASGQPPASPTALTWSPGRLQVLTHDECLELLNACDVGRVAWNEPEGPIVLPVNYAMEGTAITFRTAIDSAVARQLHLGFASFQIDEYDDVTHSGWSVLARGVVSFMESNDDFAEWAVVPWAAGERHFAMRITPLMLSGRRVLPT